MLIYSSRHDKLSFRSIIQAAILHCDLSPKLLKTTFGKERKGLVRPILFAELNENMRIRQQNRWGILRVLLQETAQRVHGNVRFALFKEFPRLDRVQCIGYIRAWRDYIETRCRRQK
jgi:hypothetical protein